MEQEEMSTFLQPLCLDRMGEYRIMFKGEGSFYTLVAAVQEENNL